MSLDQTPDGMATRRSPRSIERFCRGLKLEDLAFEQTALLLSLAQLSGWSADRIALTILDLYRVKVTAEQVWNFHGKWVTVRDGSQDLDKVEKDIAEYMILEAGITLAPPKPAYRWRWLGRPLSETIEPVCLGVKLLENSADSRPENNPFPRNLVTFCKCCSKISRTIDLLISSSNPISHCALAMIKRHALPVGTGCFHAR